MALNDILVSIHGRRLGMTSSGGVAFVPTTSTGVSHLGEISSAGVFQSSISDFLTTITDMTVGRFRSVVVATEATGTTLTNFGLSVLSSAAATAQFFVMLAPVAGVLKMIAVGQNTATEITVQGTATTILFGSTSGDKIFFQGADIRSMAVTLMGISTTRWANIGGLQTGVSITGGS